jgi:probable rRNA maturation factor
MSPTEPTAAPDSGPFDVSIAIEQCEHAVNERQLVEAVRNVLEESSFASAAISVAIIDDRAMQELNRRYLQHDWPTDVLSFVLDDDNGHLEGEVILSADTAASEAVECGWTSQSEQLLYVIHGTLHLVGYRDKTPAEVQEMRAAEARHLQHFGIDIPSQSRSSDSSAHSVRTAGWEGGQGEP